MVHRIALSALILTAAGSSASAQSLLWSASGVSGGERYGLVVSKVGGINGDGWLDFIIGARLDLVMGLAVGSATVFSGLDASVIQRFESTHSGDQFGDTAVGMGDANGDGFDDLFIGAFGFDGAAFDAGRVLAYSGFETLGETICAPAVLNSTGVPAHILATGSAVATDGDVTLTVVDLPLNSNGFFITSLDEFTVVAPGGSMGNLCIASGVIGRYSGDILNSGSAGTVSLSLDLTAFPLPMGSVAVVAGDVRYWQYWFRDMPTSNFSDALKLTFQ